MGRVYESGLRISEQDQEKEHEQDDSEACRRYSFAIEEWPPVRLGAVA